MTPPSEEQPPPWHLVLMGVSGTGKTTVAGLLHERLGWAFAEGDDFHTRKSIDKMADGRPLTDGDRIPWLGRLARWTRDHDDAGSPTLLSCSALRRTYRDVLRTGGEHTCFVHLAGDKELLRERMSERDHFMPPRLLESQLASLEHLESDEHGVTIQVDVPPEQVAQRVLDHLRRC